MASVHIKILKDPGYLFDLLFIFFLRYNKDYCNDNLIEGKEKEEKEHYARIQAYFDPIPDDLFLFFNSPQKESCFMTLNYFYRFRDEFASGYDYHRMMDALSDYPDFIRRLAQFYFHNIPEEQLDQCLNPDRNFYDLIKKSDYSDAEKRRLYEFFMDPVPYIQKLQYELMSKNMQLKRYYEKNYGKILEAYNGLSFNVLRDQLNSVKDLSFLEDTGQPFYLSFCLLNKNCLSFVPFNDGVMYLAGYDYVAAVDYLQKRKVAVRLDEFGAALGEESRVKMLDKMLEEGEVTCKALEKTFSFSGSTVYHHLTLMSRCGLIKTRNEGKTILYSIDPTYFQAVVDELAKYIKE